MPLVIPKKNKNVLVFGMRAVIEREGGIIGGQSQNRMTHEQELYR